jgi:hypothetical protein
LTVAPDLLADRIARVQHVRQMLAMMCDPPGREVLERLVAILVERNKRPEAGGSYAAGKSRRLGE